MEAPLVTRRILAMVTTAALSLCGCGTFLTFDAEAPNACVVVSGLHIPGADEISTPFVLPSPPVKTARQSFVVPLDSSVLPQGSGTRIALVSFELVAQDGATLGFVSSAQLSAVAGSSSKVVGTYTKTVDPGTTLAMNPDPPSDVTTYVIGGKLTLEGALTGNVPAKGFTAEATVCFDVTTTISATN